MDEQNVRSNASEQPQVQNQNIALDDERRVRVLSPGMLVFKRFMRNRLAIVGSVIIIAMFLFSFVGGLLTPYSESYVFKDYELMEKEYAAVTYNEEYRYLIPKGQEFDNSAKSKMILAINNGESTFDSAGQTYGLTREGEEFYRISSAQMIASGKGIKNNYTLTPVQGVSLPADFTELFNAAVAAKESSFTTADGQVYLIQLTKTDAKVRVATDLALASKLIFTGELAEDYDFRLEAERAIQKGSDTSFTVNGVPYHLEVDGDAATITDASGTEIAAASHFLMKASQVGTVYPEGFVAAVQGAIETGASSFVLTDRDGMERTFKLERKVNEYVVRTEQSTYKITMYANPSAEHWLGTDGNGMDVLTRLMYGGRVSLIFGFVVVLFETILGVILGGISGYFGRWVDNLIMRIVDIFNCIPSIPLYIIIGSVMDAMKVDPMQRIFILMILMGFLGWPSVARIVRGQILSLREQEFMTATEATGISIQRRIFRHLVPNVIPQLIVVSTMDLGNVILIEATLSFLGLGVKYPLASWGSIINAVNNAYVMTNYLFVWIPAGMLILLTVLGFNFIGDGLRDAFDPKMKR